jgi:hypothetical protein
MHDPPRLVSNADDAAKAVQTFRAALHASSVMQDRLPNARAWFAMSDDDGGWIFAPARWAGHVNMTPEQYTADNSTSVLVRKIEKRLARWFSPLDPGSVQHAELHAALADFLSEYGKQPNSVARISTWISAAPAPASDQDDLVELLIRVVRGLDSAQRARIRQAAK